MNQYTEYVVKKGDSLYKIAEDNNTTIDNLMDLNMLTNKTIFPNQVLLVPVKSLECNYYEFSNYYTKLGDTIESISEANNISPIALGKYNDFSKLKLGSGQAIVIPLSNQYTIEENDTLEDILYKTNRTASQIILANQNQWLRVGSKLKID